MRELAEKGRKRKQLETPSLGFETPSLGGEDREDDREEDGVEEMPAGLKSVDAFLGTYTSEDNASFKEIQAEDEKRRIENDIWGKEQALRRIKLEKETLRLEDNSKNSEMLLMWKDEENSQLMTIPEWREKRTQMSKAVVMAAEKIIEPTNTRFSAADLKSLQVVAKKKGKDVKSSKLKALLSRNRFLSELSGRRGEQQSHELDDFYDSPKAGEDPLAEPKVSGYGFVATPVIEPGVGVDESPLMSWGTLEG